MRKRREAGFTLIELMVVLVIMGSLIALVGPNLIRLWGDSREDIAKIQMRHLGQAVDAYRMRHRRLPSALETLSTATSEDPQPYLERLPKDPWEAAYAYQVEGQRYTLRSSGEDGQMGTEDDLVWPDPT